MKLKPYPSWVCRTCGQKAQKAQKLKTVAMCSTYHRELCVVCGKVKAVTQPRDFGYPAFKDFAA